MIEGNISFFDFIGYMYITGGTISGPYYEFNDYKNFIELKKEYANIPSTILPSLKKFITALFFVLINALLADSFHITYLYT